MSRSDNGAPSRVELKAMLPSSPKARARILFFAGSLQTGGIEMQLLHVAAGLDPNQYEPLVWCNGPWGPIADSLVARGVPVLRRSVDLSSSVMVEEMIDWLSGLRVSIFYSFAGVFWPDVVLAKAAGIPVCLTRRDSMRHWDDAGAFSLQEQARNEHTDMVVLTSRAVAEETVRVEHLPDDRVRVLRNGVPPSDMQAARPNSLMIGNVANFRPLKGQVHLVEALARVRLTVPNAKVVIAGRSAGELEPAIDSLGLRGLVTFTGELSDTSPIYRSLAVYAHPSYTEGLSCAVLEAMAHGIPVVASRVGGLPEAVEDGVTGYLVDPGDSGSLAAAIEELLLDVPKRRRMGEAGRVRLSEEFSLQQLIARHESMFRYCLARLRG